MLYRYGNKSGFGWWFRGKMHLCSVTKDAAEAEVAAVSGCNQRNGRRQRDVLIAANALAARPTLAPLLDLIVLLPTHIHVDMTVLTTVFHSLFSPV